MLTLSILLGCSWVCALVAMRRAHRLHARLVALRAYATTDAETQLRGREAFSEALAFELSRIARSAQPACLVILGCTAEALHDNDAGPRYAALGRVLRSSVREIDLCYRIGTREFAVILPETRACGGLVAVRRVESDLASAGIGPISAGIAEAGPGIDHHELFRHAYSALLSAGRDGRENVLVYSVELELRGARVADFTTGAQA